MAFRIHFHTTFSGKNKIWRISDDGRGRFVPTNRCHLSKEITIIVVTARCRAYSTNQIHSIQPNDYSWTNNHQQWNATTYLLHAIWWISMRCNIRFVVRNWRRKFDTQMLPSTPSNSTLCVPSDSNKNAIDCMKAPAATFHSPSNGRRKVHTTPESISRPWNRNA